MQAYQSAPCPYCGATWNQPGAQACANCRNPLPPPQPGYAPPGYAQPPGYPQQPGGYGPPPGYPGYDPTAAPASGPASTTLRLFGQTFTVPLALPPIVVRYQQELAYAILGLFGLIVLLFGIMPA